jgi:hypothetical protein
MTTWLRLCIHARRVAMRLRDLYRCGLKSLPVGAGTPYLGFLFYGDSITCDGIRRRVSLSGRDHCRGYRIVSRFIPVELTGLTTTEQRQTTRRASSLCDAM